MATIIHSISATLNGSCSHTDAIVDGENDAYAIDLLASADALLFGRSTYDLFAEFWPPAQSNTELPVHMITLAKALTDVKKYVISKHALIRNWSNAFLLPGPLDIEVKKIRASIPGKVVIFGSPQLASSLAAEGQIDEYQVLIQPFIIDSQPRLFASVATRQALQLISVNQFSSGVVLLKYRPKG